MRPLNARQLAAIARVPNIGLWAVQAAVVQPDRRDRLLWAAIYARRIAGKMGYVYRWFSLDEGQPWQPIDYAGTASNPAGTE